MNADQISVFSFFSGCGFLDLGFEKASINNIQEHMNIVMVNEFYSAFLTAYSYSRAHLNIPIPNPKFGYFNCDVNDFLQCNNIDQSTQLNNHIVEERELGQYIMFIGGPPCPDFSIAGTQAGRNGRNGILSQSYVDLICEKQPDFFLFENVKGLWQTQRHREYYDELKRQLQEAGYATTERLCNSLEYGVPQDRSRIILIGIHNNLINLETVRENNITNFNWNNNLIYNLEEIYNVNWPQVTPFGEDQFIHFSNDLDSYEELTVQYWFNNNHVTNHPNSHDYFRPRQGLTRMQTINEGDCNRKSYKRLHRWRYSPTAAYGNNEVHLHPYLPRRLSAAESLAIQSLPADFCLPPNMSLTDKFKTIGNGVPYLMAKRIAETFLQYVEPIH